MSSDLSKLEVATNEDSISGLARRYEENDNGRSTISLKRPIAIGYN